MSLGLERLKANAAHKILTRIVDSNFTDYEATFDWRFRSNVSQCIDTSKISEHQKYSERVLELLGDYEVNKEEIEKIEKFFEENPDPVWIQNFIIDEFCLKNELEVVVNNWVTCPLYLYHLQS